MNKKTKLRIICITMATLMLPTFSFATEENITESENQVPTIVEEQNPDEVVTQEGDEPNTEGETGIVMTESPENTTIKSSKEMVVSSKALGIGAFRDDGAVYTMENTSGYVRQMKIYVIFVHRNSGSWSSKDRYGDAVLVESNGKFLLMDTSTNTPIKNSTSVRTSSLVKTLRSIGVRDLDVYISHMHGDHTGGLKDVCNNFNVGHVFLPDIETCKSYKTPDIHKSIDAIYREKVNEAKAANPKTQIVYLTPSFRTPRAANAVNQFNVGAARCTVMGPVGTYSIAQFASQDGNCGSKEGHYLNNSSLCTMVQCGNFKYITNGDAERQEEYKLASKYGSRLNSNIMKVSHHGLNTSNTSTYVSKVSPMWSVAQNHGYSSSITGTSFRNASKYGYLFGAASRKRNLIVNVQNNAVRIYVDNNNNGKIDEAPLRGWVKSGSRYQYYNRSGYILTGWHWLSGKAYYMSGSSGFRFIGSHRINGVKVKFSSSGKLCSHRKPAKVRNKSIMSYEGQKIIIRWKKAYRASRYQVYRATSKKGKYTCLGILSSKARSFTDSGLTSGKNYYYKVRAIRYVAGAVLYGTYSEVKSVKAK